MKTLFIAMLMASPVNEPGIQQRFNEETNQIVQQELYAELLEELVRQHEEEGDLVGAYTYQYLYSQWAKANKKMHEDLGTREGQEEVWDRRRVPFYAGIHKDLARLGKMISAEDRKAAIQQAAQIDPNCCGTK